MLTPYTLYHATVLLLHFLSLVSAGAPPYTPTEYILLNCGSSTKTTSPDGRNWEGDAMSNFSPPYLQKTSSSSTAASEQHPSVTQVPYMTARLFHSQFTYTFPVSAGPKFLRLYFYPATYSDLDISTSFFSVFANTHTLLSNFSAVLTVSAIQPPVDSFIKEFCINVEDNQTLNITFSPSPSSFAFVNGIEIVSMPYNLYIGHTDKNPIKLLGYSSFFTLGNNTALETLYRLNVGGGDISVNDDTGMFRTWNDDSIYIWGAAFGVTAYQYNVTIRYTLETLAYTAPVIVYTTSRTMGPNSFVNKNYNLTWFFTIDSGFTYLIRLHFCETEPDVTGINQRVFKIYINNQTAQDDMDVISWTGGTGKPMYIDFVVLVPDQDGSRSKQDLWLALHPDMNHSPPPQYCDAILNGVEIFKLNQSNGSLAGPNPNPLVGTARLVPKPKLPEKSKSKGSLTVIVVTGAVLGVIAAISLLCFLIYWRRKRVKDFDTTIEAKSSWAPFSYTTKSTKTRSISLPSDLCHHFLIVDLKSATANFHDSFIIGKGGFGNVYKGYIDDTMVAIKRLNPGSRQGAHEFKTEIKMLSHLRYLHLVSLIGYCNDEGEMILVYDYMINGTLRDHLYETDKDPLPWKQRLEICIGAAKGLHYLHTGAERTIIHRDVKSSNILLDQKWVAKVSDFGLSKMCPISMTNTAVSTLLKGTWGYLDPEYIKRRQLTEKSDVYSFGVVLFEVLCARKAVNHEIDDDQVCLAYWVQKCISNRTLDKIIDPYLMGTIAPICLRKFVAIAERCLRDKGIDRPTMSDVVGSLEFALQLQETADSANDNFEFSGGTQTEYIYEEISLDAAIATAEQDVISCELDSSTMGTSTSGQSFPKYSNSDNYGSTMNSSIQSFPSSNSDSCVKSGEASKATAHLNE